MENRKYLPYIDGIRGISILAVLAFHLAYQTFPNGYAGVDVFFVISGYLITGTILDDLAANEFRFRTFFARRIRRILPALLATFIAVFLFGLFFYDFSDQAALNKHLAAGALFSSNFLLWSEAGYFDYQSLMKPLLHLWSLAVEEQFYLLWPFFLVFFYRKKMHLWFLLSLVLMSFLAFIFSFHKHQALSFYLLPFRFWELGLGAALIILERRHISMRIPAFLGPVFIIALTVLLFMPYLHKQHETIIAAAFLTVAIIGSSPDILRKVLSWSPLRGIGLISYPLYLIHWPIISTLRLNNISTTPVTIALVAVASIVLSTATYLFIERPLKRRLSLREDGQIRRVLLAGLSS